MYATQQKRIKELEAKITLCKDLLEFLPKNENDQTAEIKNTKAFLDQELSIFETLLFCAKSTC